MPIAAHQATWSSGRSAALRTACGALTPMIAGRGWHVLLAQHALGGQGPLPAPGLASQ
jgi:hypothetical protein